MIRNQTVASEYFIRRAIRKALKEGNEKEQLENMLVNVIGLFREEVEEPKDKQDQFLRECLENALEQA